MNNSGFKPYDIGVLVQVQAPQEKKTKAGIILDSKIEAVSIEAVQSGKLVDMGGLAFRNSDGTLYADAPKVGDEVFFVKYAGQFISSLQSEDGNTYRAMDCHDIRLIKERK